MSPYIPDSLPPTSLNWEKLIPLIGASHSELARYDGFLQSIVNPHILLSPLTTQEAVLSSRIEGTQATLEDVLEFQAAAKQKDPSKYEDIQEILNYQKAMEYAIEEMMQRPVNLNMLQGIHSILLDSVRGRNKRRGEFRKVQNWIGRLRATIDQASYVPPDPLYLMEYLTSWENYFHYEEKDRIVQLAVIHAQFEIIHPFLDGNGRVGRILIPLFLFEKGLLHSPMFYLSEYLEKHRDVYYSELRLITEEKSWDGWIEFFLTAVREQAKENSRKARAVLALYNEMKEKASSISILDALFKHPIFSTSEFTELTGLSKTNSFRTVTRLKEEGILKTLSEGKGKKPSIMVFAPLIDIINSSNL